MSPVRAFAPGRVNLIGDHTDHTGGWCFPIAIELGVRVQGHRGGSRIRLTSDTEPTVVDLGLDIEEPSAVEPEWGRYVAGVVAQLRPERGIEARVTSTLPMGVGLSSSAALEVAVALALGADRTDVVALARLCQAAEHAARGVPTGILDQLASLGGTAGCGLLLDCAGPSYTTVPLPPPDEVSWVVITPPAGRRLGASAYAERVAELRVAEDEIGPLRHADSVDVASIAEPTIRARARHVVTENERVLAFADAIAAGLVTTAGGLMDESHRSLSSDFGSSTTDIDLLCDELRRQRGVLGARITGGGWGGAVVALTRPGALDGHPGAITVTPGDGAGVR